MEQPKTREEYRRRQRDVEKRGLEVIRPRQMRTRLIPIWLRLVLLAVLTISALMGGTAVGYGMLGNGNAKDVFKKSTWTHIEDLVNKK